MAESIIGLFKTEVIRSQGPWRNRDAVEIATLGLISPFGLARVEAGGDLGRLALAEGSTPWRWRAWWIF